MNVALVGTGQMGQAVARVAPRRGHDVVAQFDSENPFLEASAPSLKAADVAVDFSLPSLALDHIRQRAAAEGVDAEGFADALDVGGAF